MITWPCAMETAVPGQRSFTVGESFLLNCAGPAQILDRSKARLNVVDDPEGFSLRLLEVKELTAEKASLRVASYRVGSQEQIKLVLTDDQNSIELQSVSFSVDSVIAGPRPTPFPAYDPWKMTYPPWMWGVLFLLLTWMAILAFSYIRKKTKRRRLVLEIEDYLKRHDPFAEFQRETRQVLRKIEKASAVPRNDLKEIENSFRLFLKRILIEEVGDLGPGQVAALISKKGDEAVSVARRVKEILVEFSRLNSHEVASKDAEQLIRWLSEASEKVVDLKAPEKGQT